MKGRKKRGAEGRVDRREAKQKQKQKKKLAEDEDVYLKGSKTARVCCLSIPA